jgi:hypothetical protein
MNGMAADITGDARQRYPSLPVLYLFCAALAFSAQLNRVDSVPI